MTSTRRASSSLLSVILVSSAFATPAFADDGYRVEQEGEQAEHAGEVDRARELYLRVLQNEPSSAVARMAAARLDWLQARGVSGTGPLSTFLKMQAVPTPTAEDIVRFEQQVDQFSTGILRSEARVYIADAWLRRLNDPVRAEVAYRRALDEPALNGADRTSSLIGLAHAQADQGHMTDALRTMKEGNQQNTPAYRQLQAGVARHFGHPVAVAMLAIFGLLVVATFSWKSPQAALSGPVSILGMMAFVLAVPFLLATRYEPANTYVMTRFAGFVGVIVLVSAITGASLRERAASLSVVRLAAAVAVLACIAAAFLAVEPSDLLEELALWRGL